MNIHLYLLFLPFFFSLLDSGFQFGKSVPWRARNGPSSALCLTVSITWESNRRSPGILCHFGLAILLNEPGWKRHLGNHSLCRERAKTGKNTFYFYAVVPKKESKKGNWHGKFGCLPCKSRQFLTQKFMLEAENLCDDLAKSFQNEESLFRKEYF